MRRALRYLRQAHPTPRVFGLFTDTTSRLTNFQPRPSEDRSLRHTSLPCPGSTQFPPIHVFTSIDAHSSILPNNYAISDDKKVAEVERLLKFGRAGWYSLYSAKSESDPRKPHYSKEEFVDFAKGKLLCLGDVGSLVKEANEQNRVRFLATLAVRLALNIGPFTVEAGQVISSHLAVLLKADVHRHLLRTYYPSEPILAEASAQIMNEVGWHKFLKTLCGHVETGIVPAGYRGELLSKVLCLMAMDDTPKPKPETEDSDYWPYTQPVKVSDFLDNWLTSPDDKEPKFTKALENEWGRALMDRDQVTSFLEGYFFFNHFIRLDSDVSIQAIVCAWNRGAAIMPKENTHSFDHVIPVMLAPKNGEAPTFGPLHDDWDDTDSDRACSNVSFILINSKNYTAAVNHADAGYGCTPNAYNFEDFTTNDPDTCKTAPVTIYLSIAQGFGPRQMQEMYVNILKKDVADGDVMLRDIRTFRQILIVLKEIGPETYKCLQEKDDGTQMIVDTEDGVPGSFLRKDSDQADESVRGTRAEATKYLNQLKTANVPDLEGVEESDVRGVLDFLPIVYSTGCDSREKLAVRKMQGQQAEQGKLDSREARVNWS